MPVSVLVTAAIILLTYLECRIGGQRREFDERIGFHQRPAAVAKGTIGGTLKRLSEFLPGDWSQAQRARMVRAGLGLEAETYLALRLICGLAGAVLGSVAAYGRYRTVALGVAAALGAGAGLFGVDWWVDARARANGSLLRGRWPYFLHRLRLCLLAGMSLERALTALADDPGTGLGAAFGRQLQDVIREIRAGVSCESALVRWGQTAEAEDILALGAAAERSRALGLPLATSLARQAAVARDRLRQDYLGWANSLPSRLSLCAMLFFLPAILIIVLLPSVLSFLRSGW